MAARKPTPILSAFGSPTVFIVLTTNTVHTNDVGLEPLLYTKWQDVSLFFSGP